MKPVMIFDFETVPMNEMAWSCCEKKGKELGKTDYGHEVDSRRKRGKFKTRWRDYVVADSREMNLDFWMEKRRIRLRKLIQNSDCA